MLSFPVSQRLRMSMRSRFSALSFPPFSRGLCKNMIVEYEYFSTGFENAFTGKERVRYFISQVYRRFRNLHIKTLGDSLTGLCILLACLDGLPVQACKLVAKEFEKRITPATISS